MQTRAAAGTIQRLLDGERLRAASFIVTVYGDVVEPRGGLLWMGTLVEVCALAGISETRVRTAVSRLVAAGRLEGTRVGRRSYYRLTPAAGAEFAAAAERSSRRRPPPTAGWSRSRRRRRRGGASPAASRRSAPGLLLGPDRGERPADGFVFRAELLQGGPTSGGSPARAGIWGGTPRPMPASSRASRRSRARIPARCRRPARKRRC